MLIRWNLLECHRDIQAHRIRISAIERKTPLRYKCASLEILLNECVHARGRDKNSILNNRNGRSFSCFSNVKRHSTPTAAAKWEGDLSQKRCFSLLLYLIGKCLPFHVYRMLDKVRDACSTSYIPVSQNSAHANTFVWHIYLNEQRQKMHEIENNLLADAGNERIERIECIFAVR